MARQALHPMSDKSQYKRSLRKDMASEEPRARLKEVIEKKDTAFYNEEILEILGLTPDHNESLRKDLENSALELNNRKDT